MKDKIKDILEILYVSYVDISEPNGPGVNEREFLSAASERWGKNFTAIIPRLSQKIDTPLNIKIVWCPRVSNMNPSSFLRHQMAIYTKLRQQIAQARHDLLIIRLGLLPLGLWLALKSRRIPYAIKTSGGFPGANIRIQNGIKRLIMQVFHPLEFIMQREILHGAIAIDACTVGLAEGAVKNYNINPKNVFVVDNATNIKRFYPQDALSCRQELGISKFDPVIGYVGGRPWERGAMQLIKVLPELIDIFPNIGTLIVGGSKEKEMEVMKKLSKMLNVADRVLFAGTVPYEKVPGYINCLDVGVAFDRKDTSEKGNANQKIRQYLACGVPVVTSGGGNDFLVKYGLGSKIDDYDNLRILKSALVKWVSMDAFDRLRFKEKARSYATNHLSVQKTLDERLRFWQQRLSRENIESD